MNNESPNSHNASSLLGRLISNRYEILSLLGAGAMGSVFLAKDRVLAGNIVAIKILKSELSEDDLIRQRFLQEVQLMHQVNHPNVVRTYDIGVDQDLIYFTMEYVSDGTLEDRLEQGPISLDSFYNLSVQICRGMHEIHKADIVHRDLKPANVMLDQAVAKISDFGVARSNVSNLTEHSGTQQQIMGSTSYISPEVWEGKEITPSTDIYGMGVIFYEMLCGVLPFEHEVLATLMWMHLQKDPTPLSELRPDVPKWLNDMVLRMLSKDPLKRPKSAGSIADSIEHAINSPEPEVTAESSIASESCFDMSVVPSVEFSESDSRDSSDSNPHNEIIFASLPSTAEIHSYEKTASARLKTRKEEQQKELDKIAEEHQAEGREVIDSKKLKMFVLGLVTVSFIGVGYAVNKLDYKEKKETEKVEVEKSVLVSGVAEEVPEVELKNFKKLQSFRQILSDTALKAASGFDVAAEVIDEIAVELETLFESLPPRPSLERLAERSEFLEALVEGWWEKSEPVIELVQSSMKFEAKGIAVIKEKKDLRQKRNVLKAQIEAVDISSKEMVREQQRGEQARYHEIKFALEGISADLLDSLKRHSVWEQAATAIQNGQHELLVKKLLEKDALSPDMKTRLEASWLLTKEALDGTSEESVDLELKRVAAEVVADQLEKSSSDLIALSALYLKSKEKLSETSTNISEFRTFSNSLSSATLHTPETIAKRKTQIDKRLDALDTVVAEEKEIAFDSKKFLAELEAAEDRKAFLQK